MNKNILVVDNLLGNSGSVLNMIKRAGHNAVISSDLDIMEKADKIIFPGVGSFDQGISTLKNSNFFSTLERKVIKDKVPFLGICLGMQMLFEKSEEGKLAGLGWLKGNVKRFDFKTEDYPKLKIPHMGWNIVHPSKKNLLLSSDEKEYRFYFVHSYHVQCDNSSDVIAHSHYGYDFACMVQHDNIFGAQFHPEKSHRFGLELIKKFIEI